MLAPEETGDDSTKPQVLLEPQAATHRPPASSPSQDTARPLLSSLSLLLRPLELSSGVVPASSSWVVPLRPCQVASL